MNNDIVAGVVAIAKVLDVSRDSVYKLCNQGMPFRQMKNGRVFVKGEIKEWLVKEDNMLQFRL